MVKRNEEAHAACLNILSDNKDSAPRIAELCTLSRRLGSEVDALTAERVASRSSIEHDLRAVYRDAYMAALGGACADTNVVNPVKDAHALALETVRQWVAMQAELEQEISK